ncbi:MAG: NigD-like protein [Porphyromonadaceae bacterium]|nr:NigD-like protein [Porphyromonadaceae bacterium]
MKNFLLFWIVLLLLSVAGCEEEPKRLDDYFVDFATVKKNGSSYRFQLDNGRLLIPRETDYSGQEGQRVILNYVFLQGDTVKIQSAGNILTGVVQAEGFPEKLVKDPVKIQSIWVGGDYLNMIIEAEYHSEPHRVGLLRNVSSPTVDLYFSHSREQDPPGYPQKMYASFLIGSLRTGKKPPITFRLFIQTYDGLREMPFVLN